MKKILLFLFLFWGLCVTSAQSQENLLYLKNGSIIRGTVIKMIPNESVTIETKDKSVFVYDFDDVLKVEKNLPVNKSNNSGYRGFIELGTGVDNVFDIDRLALSTIHGYQFNPFFFVGVGASFQIWKGDRSYLPIFLDFRGKFDKRHSPYIEIRVGADLFSSNDGYYISPIVGYRYAISQKMAVNIGVGMEFSKQCEGGLDLNVNFEF